MANSFCKYLSNGLRIQTDWGKLNANPCCLVRSAPIYFSDPEFIQKFEQFHTMDKCNDCFPSYQMRNRARTDILGDPENGIISFIELSIDIDCNAACLSCTDSYSSTWVAQNKKFKIKTVDDYPDPQNPVQVVNDLFEKFDLTNLQKISFLGGEPIKAPTTELFLEKLVNLCSVKDIHLNFVTNGSVNPSPNLVDLMSEFKSVSVNFSIDAIGKRFEYLRYPLSWKKVLKVIEYFGTLDIEKFSINCTLDPFNVYYCDELINWTNTFFSNDQRFFKINFSEAGGILTLNAITPKFKELLLEKYSENINLNKIISSIKCCGHTELLTYINQMDQLRKLSWQNTFPEIQDYFSQHKG